MNNCKLTSQFTAHNYLSFLTAVSWEDWRLGFPPLFDNCPPKKTKQRKRKKVDFFLLWRKRPKVEKTREMSLSSFLRSVRYKYYSRKLLHFISKTKPKNIRLFVRKGALFSSFHNGDWKLKKGFLFSVLNPRFFTKSRIAETDHWLKVNAYLLNNVCKVFKLRIGLYYYY